MAAVRRVTSTVTFAGVVLDNVLSVRGQVVADTGWPSCSVFVTSKPPTGNQEDAISVVAGAGTNVTRFVGRVRRFRPSAFPKSIEMVCSGTLAYAAEWSPDEDLLFDDEDNFPDGATDQDIVAWALGKVPGVVYDTANLDGTGVILGTTTLPTPVGGAPEAFDWTAGTSAWSYIQQLDRATLYRTYQTSDGTIMRVKMIGHPNNVPDFTLTPADMLDGASGNRDTERTRNFVRVVGYDYGKGEGPVMAELAGNNDFQGDGSDPATRHVSVFQSNLIESGIDPDDGSWDGASGLRADDIAAAILPDVNKEFVEATIPSWHDELHGPGMTALVDALDRLAIGEPMWVAGYSWEVGDNGWTATYSLTGGGLPQDYEPPPV